MEWVLYSIIAVLIWSVVNIVDKHVLTKHVKSPFLPLMILGIIGIIASVFVYFFLGFKSLSSINILLALLAGVFYALMSFLYYEAVQLEEISRIIPLFNLSMIFTLVIATIFLNEVFTLIKYVGIFLLFIGSILVSIKKITIIKFGKAFWLLVLSSFFLSFNQVITKYLLGFTDYWTVFSWTRIGVFIFLIPLFVIYLPKISELITPKKSAGKIIGIISANEFVNIFGVISFTIAASYGFISLVNALTSTQPLVVLIIAVLLSIFYPKIIKEEIDKSTLIQKTIAIICIIIGVILIS